MELPRIQKSLVVGKMISLAERRGVAAVASEVVKRGKAQYWTGTFLSQQHQLAAPLSRSLSRWGGRFRQGKWRNRRWCRRLGGSLLRQ
jgi:hypothetical protein